MRSKEALQRRILELCEERNISVHKMCRIAGITQSTINNLLSSRNNSITVATVVKICDGLEITIQEFFAPEYFRHLEQEIV